MNNSTESVVHVKEILNIIGDKEMQIWKLVEKVKQSNLTPEETREISL